MGSADIEGRERLVYMNETPSADDPKVLTLQTVTYVLKDGRIEGIAVSQVTAN